MSEESYTDDADVSHLETRIDELEETIRKMLPSRREAIGMGVAGLAGASLMSGTASAGSAQVGTIGDSNNLVDVEAEDINVSDTINGASVSGAANGEALTSDGSGGLSFAEVGGGVPPNFSYNDVKASRSVNTIFTNNTGKALYVVVMVQLDADDSSWGAFVEVNGVTILQELKLLNSGTFNDFSRTSFSFFVPDGADYEIKVTGTVVVAQWHEAQM